MSFIIEHWDTFGALLVALGGGGWGLFVKKAKDELVEVIDKSSNDNLSFKTIARTHGKKAAAKALAKLAG